MDREQGGKPRGRRGEGVRPGRPGGDRGRKIDGRVSGSGHTPPRVSVSGTTAEHESWRYGHQHATDTDGQTTEPSEGECESSLQCPSPSVPCSCSEACCHDCSCADTAILTRLRHDLYERQRQTEADAVLRGHGCPTTKINLGVSACEPESHAPPAGWYGGVQASYTPLDVGYSGQMSPGQVQQMSPGYQQQYCAVRLAPRLCARNAICSRITTKM